MVFITSSMKDIGGAESTEAGYKIQCDLFFTYMPPRPKENQRSFIFKIWYQAESFYDVYF